MVDVKIFAENLEESAKKQVDEIASCPAFEGATIRIMPDAHAGKGCVIGFTANLGDKVIPNLVGVDIGCGMLCAPLDERIDRGDLIQFNRDVKKAVPTGFSVHNEPKCSLENDYGVVNGAYLKGVERIECSMGTLGGGNHFVELDEDEYGYQYLVVHTGSRNLGKQVAEYHQTMAQEMCKEDVPRDLKYLVSFAAGAYLNDMRICQRYATDNRFHILKQIKERTGIKLDLSARFETMHNYISDDNVIRKGAISAHTGEKVLIPFNMRDGSVIAVGKGNNDWNESAPHGAGRVMSRAQARANLDTEKFVSEMKEAGIYCPSACEATLDESPEAYKSAEEILRLIEPTVEVIHHLKPIWNLKATDMRGWRHDRSM